MKVTNLNVKITIGNPKKGAIVTERPNLKSGFTSSLSRKRTQIKREKTKKTLSMILMH